MISHVSFMIGILIINSIIYLKIFINAKKYAKFKRFLIFSIQKATKLLKNVKTHWISMLSPTNYVYYKLLIMKMHTKNAKSDAATKRMGFLCNVELILGLPCIHCLTMCIH